MVAGGGGGCAREYVGVQGGEGRGGKRGSMADRGGRRRNICWRIIHPTCIAASSRLSLDLPAHWNHFSKPGCGEVEEQAACSFSETAAWWLA